MREIHIHIHRGTGKLDVGEFGREAERLIEQVDRLFGKGVAVLFVLGLQSIPFIYTEMARNCSRNVQCQILGGSSLQ